MEPRESAWETILRYARLAPSPHNVQPWRVRVVSDEEAELFIDPARILPREDTTGAFLLSAMGMFVEAARIAAHARGWSLSVCLSQEPAALAEAVRHPGPDLIPYAHIRRTVTGATIPDYDPALLGRRRTSRLSYKKQPIAASTHQILANLAAVHGQQYVPIDDPTTLRCILDGNTRALFHDLNTPDYHDEIVSWFRFTPRAAAATRDGLSARCMNSPTPLFWAVAHFPCLLQVPVLQPLLSAVYRQQIGHVPAIGILAGPFFAPESSIAAGAFLMRFWLELARQDLYIHPFGNLVTNHVAAKRLERETGIPDTWLVFKIGYSAEPPAALRRTREEIKTDETMHC